MTHTTLEALKLYVALPSNATSTWLTKQWMLAPQLLRETLLTLDLLFPIIGDNESRLLLEKEVQKNQLDTYFLSRFYLGPREHERPSDALDPSDIRSLYEKYLYWADKLFDIWREADDPTPTTRIERWTDARRNPRFTY